MITSYKFPTAMVCHHCDAPVFGHGAGVEDEWILEVGTRYGPSATVYHTECHAELVAKYTQHRELVMDTRLYMTAQRHLLCGQGLQLVDELVGADSDTRMYLSRPNGTGSRAMVGPDADIIDSWGLPTGVPLSRMCMEWSPTRTETREILQRAVVPIDGMLSIGIPGLAPVELVVYVVLPPKPDDVSQLQPFVFVGIGRSGVPTRDMYKLAFARVVDALGVRAKCVDYEHPLCVRLKGLAAIDAVLVGGGMPLVANRRWWVHETSGVPDRPGNSTLGYVRSTYRPAEAVMVPLNYSAAAGDRVPDGVEYIPASSLWAYRFVVVGI